MSVVSYVLKTPGRDICRDIEQYRKLSGYVKFVRKECAKKWRALEYDNDACISAQTGDVCARFCYDSVCKLTVCKYYDLNADYFNTLHECRAAEKQRKIYWTQKFANCR